MVLRSGMTRTCHDAFVIALSRALYCRWDAVFVKCFSLSNVHYVSNLLLTNSRWLYVRQKVEIQYGTIHWSKKNDATCAAKGFDDGIARSRFVLQSVILKTNWFSVVLFGTVPKNIRCHELHEPSGAEQIHVASFLMPPRFTGHSQLSPTVL